MFLCAKQCAKHTLLEGTLIVFMFSNVISQRGHSMNCNPPGYIYLLTYLPWEESNTSHW